MWHDSYGMTHHMAYAHARVQRNCHAVACAAIDGSGGGSCQEVTQAYRSWYTDPCFACSPEVMTCDAFNSSGLIPGFCVVCCCVGETWDTATIAGTVLTSEAKYDTLHITTIACMHVLRNTHVPPPRH